MIVVANPIVIVLLFSAISAVVLLKQDGNQSHERGREEGAQGRQMSQRTDRDAISRSGGGRKTRHFSKICTLSVTVYYMVLQT